ncbi:MAG: uncharacterized protein KVP18_000211 [Porospora cf. gigantea A]|uniref:uncharacterized protein n=1 Tax=Porospora cf. gigantea A TaxID=2853593 RepID=UPI0035593915|nr:MAG: hypothetical protein KVP18_000211 [Porospora cf. gigantea A]
MLSTLLLMQSSEGHQGVRGARPKPFATSSSPAWLSRELLDADSRLIYFDSYVAWKAFNSPWKSPTSAALFARKAFLSRTNDSWALDPIFDAQPRLNTTRSLPYTQHNQPSVGIWLEGFARVEEPSICGEPCTFSLSRIPCGDTTDDVCYEGFIGTQRLVPSFKGLLACDALEAVGASVFAVFYDHINEITESPTSPTSTTYKLLRLDLRSGKVEDSWALPSTQVSARPPFSLIRVGSSGLVVFRFDRTLSLHLTFWQAADPKASAQTLVIPDLRSGWVYASDKLRDQILLFGDNGFYERMLVDVNLKSLAFSVSPLDA